VKVFIVAAREDSYLHGMISAALQRERIGVWIDAAATGRPFEEDLRLWMSDAELIVVIWSRNSQKSRSMQLEWKIAIELEKRILLVGVGDVDLPELPNQCALMTIDEPRSAGPDYLISSAPNQCIPIRPVHRGIEMLGFHQPADLLKDLRAFV
jgi:hypothetical protein